MKTSNNEQVELFLGEILLSNEEHYTILQALRELVFSIHPTTTERIMYGGIMFTGQDDWGGIFPYKNHISFEFSHGTDLSNPDKLLEGNGKYRRHLKISSMEDNTDKQVTFFVKQIT